MLGEVKIFLLSDFSLHFDIAVIAMVIIFIPRKTGI